jgi:hypothetical protein
MQEGDQEGNGHNRNAGLYKPLSSSPTGSSEQHHKRHKAQNVTSSTTMSIDGAGVPELVVSDNIRSSDAGPSTDPLTNCQCSK